jgi:hypothetical protein
MTAVETKPCVKYVGFAHKRIVSAQSWSAIGITAPTVVWDESNDFSVPVAKFTEPQQEYLLKVDRTPRGAALFRRV